MAVAGVLLELEHDNVWPQNADTAASNDSLEALVCVGAVNDGMKGLQVHAENHLNPSIMCGFEHGRGVLTRTSDGASDDKQAPFLHVIRKVEQSTKALVADIGRK